MASNFVRKMRRLNSCCLKCTSRRLSLNISRQKLCKAISRNSQSWYTPCVQSYSTLKPISPDSNVLEDCSVGIEFPKTCRTNKSDPGDHTLQDEGLFYTIPENIFQILHPGKGSGTGFLRPHLQEFHTFNEPAIMIRKPALEIINYLKHSEYSNPVQRYLLYGDRGTGKSVVLQHITHACLSQGWLIVPTIFALDWATFKRKYKVYQREEILESQWNIERLDQPVRATAWLETFKIMNKNHLAQINTTREYIWTKREKTEVGTPLSSLVDHGIARARIATDVIGCIMRELRTQPSENLPKILVTVDSVNALFCTTQMKYMFTRVVEPNQLSFVHNLKKMMANTWSNGAVVVATSGRHTSMYTKEGDSDAQNTYDTLGNEAFDLLDPHIPIEVENYSDKELLHHLAYYQDRKWITGRALTPQGKQEIIQLACNNPLELSSFCGSLF